MTTTVDHGKISEITNHRNWCEIQTMHLKSQKRLSAEAKPVIYLTITNVVQVVCTR